SVSSLRKQARRGESFLFSLCVFFRLSFLSLFSPFCLLSWRVSISLSTSLSISLSTSLSFSLSLSLHLSI
ncbi:hypothetical protein CSUI_007332, partial [Cystoisospora suis]